MPIVEGKYYWWRKNEKEPWELAQCVLRDKGLPQGAQPILKFFNGSQISAPIWGECVEANINPPEAGK